MTFGSAMDLLLSIGALGLTIGILFPATRIYLRWRKGDDEEKHELEKAFYLTYSAVVIILGIRLFLIPLYFWTMQGFVPMIPGAMCLWGVFNALPELTWGSLFLKLVVPVAYIGWLLLSQINGKCKTHPLMQNMMAFFIVIAPLVLLDSAADIFTFSRMTPVQVNCCSDAIDVGVRPIPILIGGVSGQVILLAVFFLLAALLALSLFLASKHRAAHWAALALSLPVGGILVLTITEALTPWLLRLPFHHCPFCLFFLHPLAILFTGLIWFALATPWLTWITSRLGRENEESKENETQLRKTLHTYSGIALIIALTLMAVDLFITFA
ncbi:MAG: hypothetical protein ACE14S_02185 [Candidatus Bathyarchaeia archaeon]